jgi:hypothetical protein
LQAELALLELLVQQVQLVYQVEDSQEALVVWDQLVRLELRDLADNLDFQETLAAQGL